MTKQLLKVLRRKQTLFFYHHNDVAIKEIKSETESEQPQQVELLTSCQLDMKTCKGTNENTIKKKTT